MHLIPVFAADDEPGWLLFTKRMYDGPGEVLADLLEKYGDRYDLSWEPDVKSWFILHEHMDDVVDAVIFHVPGEVVFCADCKDGSPCEAWAKIPRLDYLHRLPDELETPPRARMEYAGDLFRWGDAKPSPPPSPAGKPSHDDEWLKNFRVFRVTPATQHGAVPDPFKEFFNRVSVFVNDVFGPPPEEVALPVNEAAHVLGVPWPCTKEVLLSAYRKAALAAHPDRGGSTERMAAINVARDRLLRDLEMR